jgi:hypothetical protein
MEAATGDKAREALVAAWKQLLKDSDGRLTEAEMERMSLDEVSERVFGLSGTREGVRNARLDDMLRSKGSGSLPEEDFRKYVDLIKRRYVEVWRIISMDDTQYPYSFRSDEIRYYWIPEDLIP